MSVSQLTASARKYIVRDAFGHPYVVLRRHDAPIERALEAKRIQDSASAHSFVWSLRLDDEGARALLGKMDIDPNLAHTRQTPRQALIASFERSELLAYPVPHLKRDGLSGNYRAFPGANGDRYLLVSAGLLLTHHRSEAVLFFGCQQHEAEAFLNQLNLTGDDLAEVIASLELPWPQRVTDRASLLHALRQGWVVAIRERPAPNFAPPVAPVVEPATGPGVRAATLGSHAGNAGRDPLVNRPAQPRLTLKELTGWAAASRATKGISARHVVPSRFTTLLLDLSAHYESGEDRIFFLRLHFI